jgi:hypothetical protein
VPQSDAAVYYFLSYYAQTRSSGQLLTLLEGLGFLNIALVSLRWPQVGPHCARLDTHLLSDGNDFENHLGLD